MLGRVLLGSILAGVGGGEEESVAAVIGGIVIGVSAIPVWYRDRIERLKARGAHRSLAAGFEDRLAEMEHRNREQIVHLEQAHTERIAELEERIDFAERLLADRREQIGPG
jgi:hypothetical protein